MRHWQQTLRHELFEYEGRMSQLMKLVEIDVPYAIGVLTRILRSLEEYQSLRAANPRKSYDDVAMARERISAILASSRIRLHSLHSGSASLEDVFLGLVRTEPEVRQ